MESDPIMVDNNSPSKPINGIIEPLGEHKNDCIQIIKKVQQTTKTLQKATNKLSLKKQTETDEDRPLNSESDPIIVDDIPSPTSMVSIIESLGEQKEDSLAVCEKKQDTTEMEQEEDDDLLVNSDPSKRSLTYSQADPSKLLSSSKLKTSKKGKRNKKLTGDQEEIAVRNNDPARNNFGEVSKKAKANRINREDFSVHFIKMLQQYLEYYGEASDLEELLAAVQPAYKEEKISLALDEGEVSTKSRVQNLQQQLAMICSQNMDRMVAFKRFMEMFILPENIQSFTILNESLEKMRMRHTDMLNECFSHNKCNEESAQENNRKKEEIFERKYTNYQIQKRTSAEEVKIRNIERDIKKLTSEIHTEEQRLTALSQDVRSIDVAIQELTLAIQNKESDLKGLMTKSAELESELQEVESQELSQGSAAKRVQEELNEAEISRIELETLKQSVISEMEVAKGIKEEKEARLVLVESNRYALETKVKELNNLTEETRRRRDEVNIEFENTHTKNTELSNEHDHIQEGLKELGKQVESVIEEKRSMQTQIADLEKKVDLAESQETNARTKKTNQENDSKNLSHEIQSRIDFELALKESIEKFQQEYEGLTREVNDAQERNKKYEQEDLNLNTELKDLNKRREEAIAKLNDSRCNQESYLKTLDELDAEANKIRKQIDTNCLEADQQNSSSTSKEVEIQKMRARFNAMMKPLKQSQDKLNSSQIRQREVLKNAESRTFQMEHLSNQSSDRFDQEYPLAHVSENHETSLTENEVQKRNVTRKDEGHVRNLKIDKENVCRPKLSKIREFNMEQLIDSPIPNSTAQKRIKTDKATSKRAPFN